MKFDKEFKLVFPAGMLLDTETGKPLILNTSVGDATPIITKKNLYEGFTAKDRISGKMFQDPTSLREFLNLVSLGEFDFVILNPTVDSDHHEGISPVDEVVDSLWRGEGENENGDES